MKVTCPHCDDSFDIVTNEELLELGIRPNVRARALEKGVFPKPWVEFGNRHIWLKEDVVNYLAEQSLRETEVLVDPLLERIMRLPDDRQEAALRLIQEKLESAGKEPTPSKKR